jgi:hypothetical protein
MGSFLVPSRRMLRAGRITLAAVSAVCGCSDEPTITCNDRSITAYTHTFDADDFPYAGGTPGIDLDMTDGDAPAPRTLAVVFEPARDPFADGDHSACPVLDDDVTASIEALTAMPGEAGGWQCHADTVICARTTLTMAISAGSRDPDATVNVIDRTGTRSIPLGDALVERTLAPVGVADWTFHANQKVTFRWTPASDLAVLTDVLVAYLRRPDGTSIPIAGCTVSGPGTIACKIPAGDTGDGMFAIDLTGHVDQPAAQFQIHRVVQHAGKIVP